MYVIHTLQCNCLPRIMIRLLVLFVLLSLVNFGDGACVQVTTTVSRCRVSANERLKSLLISVGPETERLFITGTKAELGNGTFELANLAKVTELTMDGLGLKIIPDNVFKDLHKLKKISLVANSISNIGGLPKSVESLDLSRNFLTQLPRLDGSCLVDLNLSMNALIEIRCEKFEDGKCLRVLDVSRNYIKLIIAEFSKSLLRLDLSYNDINWKDSRILAVNLRELVAKNAALYHSEERNPFEGIPSLESVDMSDSKLYRLPSSLKQIAKTLKVLRLSNNPIDTLKETSFVIVPNLRELYIDACKIETIIGAPFFSLKKLEVLDLSGNNIKAINQTFLNSSVVDLRLPNCQISAISSGTLDFLPRLQYLDLSRNLLRSLHSQAFKYIGNASIDVSMNPIFCDCYIRDIRNWIMENRADIKLYCYTPGNLSKRKVVSLEDEELDCSSPVVDDCCYRVVYAYSQSDITIHFEVHSKPFATMSYTVINGDPLPDNSTEYTPTKHTVMLHNVSEANSGNFSCTATNEFGHRTVNVSLKVFPGNPVEYKVELAEIIAIVLISTIVLFSLVWLVVFVCSKNRYFVYKPWVDDEAESSYGSINMRR